MARITDVERLVLEGLAKPGADTRLGVQGGHGVGGATKAQAKANGHPEPRDWEIQSAVWHVVALGLAYIDYHSSASSNWSIRLTTAGAALLSNEEYSPRDPVRFIERLSTEIPDISATTLLYLREAVNAYDSELYLAASVMLGVASEAAFLELADAFVTWRGPEAQKLRELLESPRTSINVTAEELKKRLQPLAKQLPLDGESLTLNVDSVFDLIRVTRNDAGHPTGRLIESERVLLNLRLATRYLKTIYALIRHFQSEHASEPAPSSPNI